MLQSIKRAFRLQPSQPQLHSCLIRFALKLVTLRKHDPPVEQPVMTVLDQEMEPILRGRSAEEINNEYLAENSKNLPALFEGATIFIIYFYLIV